MTIKPIKTKKDYNQALIRLEKIFDAKNGQPFSGHQAANDIQISERHEN